jgi:hypothetical protein
VVCFWSILVTLGKMFRKRDSGPAVLNPTPQGRSVLQDTSLAGELSNRIQKDQNPKTLLDSFASCDLEKLGTTHFASDLSSDLELRVSRSVTLFEL